MVRGFIKKILNSTYRPLLQQYLAHDREYSYGGISVIVKKGVFHPGFFFSTKFLLEEVEKLPLTGKTFLELGCGSGLIAIVAAQKGAQVLASDINPAAVSCASENAFKNSVQVETIQSDVFTNISPQQFDYIIINPPYYRGKPVNMEAAGWYCGEQMEYFEKLFQQLGMFIHKNSLILMVISEDCETDAIKQIAVQTAFQLVLKSEKKNWMEKNFIYEIRKA